MDSWAFLVLSFACGSLMGFLYFWGLWRTVRRLADASRPLRLLAISYAARVVLVMGGFYAIMDGSWARLASAILGFLIVRKIMVETLGRVPRPDSQGAVTWK